MSGEVVNIIPGNTLEAIKSIPDKSVHVCIYSPPYWNKRQYVTPVYEGGDAECKHGRGLVCSKCGAKRVDNELGAEAVHDCYGWVTGNNCGELRDDLTDDEIVYVYRELIKHGVLAP